MRRFANLRMNSLANWQIILTFAQQKEVRWIYLKKEILDLFQLNLGHWDFKH